jgi:hypothetical protein
MGAYRALKNALSRLALISWIRLIPTNVACTKSRS